MDYFIAFIVAVAVALLALTFIYRLLDRYVAELQVEVKRLRSLIKRLEDRNHDIEHELLESDKTIIELQAKLRWGHDEAK